MGLAKVSPMKNSSSYFNLLVIKAHKLLLHSLPVHASAGITDFHFLWHTSVDYTSAYLQTHSQMQPKEHMNVPIANYAHGFSLA